METEAYFLICYFVIAWKTVRVRLVETKNRANIGHSFPPKKQRRIIYKKESFPTYCIAYYGDFFLKIFVKQNIEEHIPQPFEIERINTMAIRGFDRLIE